MAVLPEQSQSKHDSQQVHGPVKRDIIGTFDYYGGEPGIIPTVDVEKPETHHVSYKPTAKPVLDLRGIELDFTLDKAGFQVVNHKTSFKDWSDDDKIRAVYEPEMTELVKRV